MTYIRPEDVGSPREHWCLSEVLLDGGEGGCSYALGTWDERPRIAMRWNGTAEAPKGNPLSHGYPTWTMLDEELHGAVVANLPEEKILVAAPFLGVNIVEMHVHQSAARIWTLEEIRPGQSMKAEVEERDLHLNRDVESFFKAFLARLQKYQADGTQVVVSQSTR